MITNPLHRIPTRPLLALILAISVLLRLGVALYHGNSFDDIRGGTHDQITYDALAQRVAGGHGFTFDRDWWPNTRAGEPTAHWSYIYTGFLAGIYSLVGHHPVIARLAQALVVGILMPLLLYRVSRRIFDDRIALIAAAIGALYLYFVHYAASLMTEAFYITSLLWTVDAAMRLAETMPAPSRHRRTSVATLLSPGLELGVAMAVTLLLRTVGVFLLAVMCLWLLWVAWRHRRLTRTLQVFGVAGAIVVLSIAPWVVRNYLAFDVFTPLPNTNSGFAFFWANHPIYGTRFEAVLSPDHGVSYQELIPPELRGLNEAQQDRALLARGLEFVRDDPRRYVLLCLSRIPIYFMFWPTAESSLLSNVSRVFSFGVVLPFMLYGLFLSLRDLGRSRPSHGTTKKGTSPSTGTARSPSVRRFDFVILILLSASAYTLIHLLSWANVRYRLPVDALLIPFAALAISDLVDRINAKKPRD